MPAPALGVQVIALEVLHHHPEAHDAVIVPEAFYVGQDKVPKENQSAYRGGAHADEPPFAHPSDPGHGDKDEQIDQHHAEVPGQYSQQSGKQAGEEGVFDQGGKSAQSPWTLFVDHPGQYRDVGQLGDLSGLEAEGDVGDIDPAGVAAVAAFAEGLEKQDDPQTQQEEHPPPFFHQILDVDEGDPHVCHHAQADELGLLEGQICEFGIILGGAVDEHQAHKAGQKAQQKQDYVPFFEEIPECARWMQGGASFPVKTDYGENCKTV